MSLYRYYLYGANNRIRRGATVKSQTNSEAIAEGQKLLAKYTRYAAVEIWLGEEFISGINRDGTPYFLPRPVKPYSSHTQLLQRYLESKTS